MAEAAGFRDTMLHQAISPQALFQLVNVAHWDSQADLEAAQGSGAFQDRIRALREDTPAAVLRLPSRVRYRRHPPPHPEGRGDRHRSAARHHRPLENYLSAHSRAKTALAPPRAAGRSQRRTPASAHPARRPAGGDAEAVEGIDGGDLDEQAGEGLLVVVLRGLVPDLVRDGVWPVGQPGGGLG